MKQRETLEPRIKVAIGAIPILKTPCRMEIVKLQELKEQLDGLEENGSAKVW